MIIECSAVVLPDRGMPTMIAPPATSVDEKYTEVTSWAPLRPIGATALSVVSACHQVAGSALNAFAPARYGGIITARLRRSPGSRVPSVTAVGLAWLRRP